MSDIELNNGVCGEMLLNQATWDAVEANKANDALTYYEKHADMDPSSELWAVNKDGFEQFDTIAEGTELYDEVYNDYTGLDLAEAFCKGEYDLNAIAEEQEGYCCQAYTHAGTSRVDGLLSKA